MRLVTFPNRALYRVLLQNNDPAITNYTLSALIIGTLASSASFLMGVTTICITCTEVGAHGVAKTKVQPLEPVSEVRQFFRLHSKHLQSGGEVTKECKQSIQLFPMSLPCEHWRRKMNDKSLCHLLRSVAEKACLSVKPQVRNCSILSRCGNLQTHVTSVHCVVVMTAVLFIHIQEIMNHHHVLIHLNYSL